MKINDIQGGNNKLKTNDEKIYTLDEALEVILGSFSENQHPKENTE